MTELSNRRGRPKVHFFDEMEPGDTWFYPQGDKCIRRMQKNLITVANRNDGRYTSRIVSLKGERGVAVRRIS